MDADSRIFSIDVLSQHLLGDYPDNRYDLCSHGKLSIVINGIQVADDEEYGISESALSLLRTLERDYPFDRPTGERLILHGCGTRLMMGCHCGIDWSARHIGSDVCISNVARFSLQDTYYPEAEVMVPLVLYRQEILKMAETVLSFFDAQPRRKILSKKQQDASLLWEHDRREYREFWREYKKLYKNQMRLAAF